MWWARYVRPLQRAGSRIYGSFHDTLDQLTGIEKRELLAHLAGECDPFRIMAIKKGDQRAGTYFSQRISLAIERGNSASVLGTMPKNDQLDGPGTYECPNLIPSAYCSRLVGCVCHPDAMHIEYMWVHMGWPRRCGCGYWFELCPIAPFV